MQELFDFDIGDAPVLRAQKRRVRYFLLFFPALLSCDCLIEFLSSFEGVVLRIYFLPTICFSCLWSTRKNSDCVGGI